MKKHDETAEYWVLFLATRILMALGEYDDAQRRKLLRRTLGELKKSPIWNPKLTALIKGKVVV